MNLIDADKLLEHLGEKHTGYVGDYRLRMAIEAAKVDIGSVIRREIAEALRNLDALYQGKHSGYLGRAIMETADELDPPSAEPVAPACGVCNDTGKCEIFCKCGAGTRAKNAEMVR